jgi:hypothetical protein
VIAPVPMFLMNTSGLLLVSPVTSSRLSETNATLAESGDQTGR